MCVRSPRKHGVDWLTGGVAEARGGSKQTRVSALRTTPVQINPEAFDCICVNYNIILVSVTSMREVTLSNNQKPNSYFTDKDANDFDLFDLTQWNLTSEISALPRSRRMVKRREMEPATLKFNLKLYSIFTFPTQRHWATTPWCLVQTAQGMYSTSKEKLNISQPSWFLQILQLRSDASSNHKIITQISLPLPLVQILVMSQISDQKLVNLRFLLPYPFQFINHPITWHYIVRTIDNAVK